MNSYVPLVAEPTPRFAFFTLIATVFLALFSGVASACPFCSALQPTLSDDLNQATAVVIARCEESAVVDGAFVTRLRLETIIKGDDGLRGTRTEMALSSEMSNKLSANDRVLLLGFGQPLQWDPPKLITPDGVTYVRGLSRLPKQGPNRLAYFLEHLKHTDEAVASDAYNEFAEATLEDIAGLKEKLDRRWILAQLRDASAPVHQRRLCWTFLSLCGTVSDTVLFEELLRERESGSDREPGLDAAIACYMALGGEEALARIERDFLASHAASDSETFAAVSAIRVHATEFNQFPQPRLTAALRHVLNRPALADLVIADLARSEDWSVIDRMVELFEKAPVDNRLVKPAVVLYLKTCPKPAAVTALKRLRLIDPEAVRFAEASLRMYPGLPSIPVPPPE